MRGKPEDMVAEIVGTRITPAYAGKTSQIVRVPARSWDHPRVCGENTSYAQFKSFVSKDHPRVCGENSAALSSQTLSRGSPPRMRGKRGSVKEQDALHGITPAYAGKTILGMTLSSKSEDHPRVCGENSAGWCCSMRTAGSPPRMRGKQDYSHIRLARGRITPAYAGKTEKVMKAFGEGEDHPRVCGENLYSLKRRLRLWGSPPRMRGKLIMQSLVVTLHGITPAYAGKTTVIRTGVHGY